MQHASQLCNGELYASHSLVTVVTHHRLPELLPKVVLSWPCAAVCRQLKLLEPQ